MVQTRNGLVGVLALFVSGFSLSLAAAANAVPAFSDAFFFGASWTDSGNTSSEFVSFPSGTCGSQPAPYVGGTCSNGPVWSELFAQGLGLSADPATSGGTNYAVGGATAASDILSNSAPRYSGDPWAVFADPDGNTEDFGDQLGRYFGDSGGTADPNALYVIMPAGNDIHFTVRGTIANDPDVAQNAVDAIIAIALQLEAAGAQNILFVNMLDFGLVPDADLDLPALGTPLSDEFNTLLASAVGSLTGLNTYLFDLNATFDDMVNDPSFTGASPYCLADPLCQADPTGPVSDQYLFFDTLHPTTAGAALIAQGALAAVPEPTTAALLALGLAGLAVRRGRARAA